MSARYLVAIVAHRVGDELKFAKYRHNLKDTEHYKRKFIRDMQERFTFLYVNWYDKQTGVYLGRDY